MRIAVVGVCAVGGLALAAAAFAVGPSDGHAQKSAAVSPGGGGLVTLVTSSSDSGQQLTVIDPETRAMAVYHIDAANGVIVLKSVRNIHYDLRMIEFNGTNPLPGEIRALLEQ
ncbi:MAG: hypothetical protein AB7O59_19345 [Pirellulales bacterium]